MLGLALMAMRAAALAYRYDVTFFGARRPHQDCCRVCNEYFRIIRSIPWPVA